MYSGPGHHCQLVRDMSLTTDLLDKYKQTCSIASDNACAVALGVSRQAVSKWRNGENHPDADIVEKMCEATGEPIARWLPLMEAERARSPSVRKAWLRLAQIAAAITLTVGVFGPSSVAHADVGNFAKSADSVYYVKT
jgi:transcriptional regulator with XRE-family HTH domain